MSEIPVSVVIVSWNVRDLLLSCLKSIYETDLVVVSEIIVVDNASSDGTAMAVREKFPSVKLLESGGNIGFARACNLGAEKAVGKYLFFLNPDAELKSKTIAGLLSLLESKEEAAAGSKLLWLDGAYQDSYRRFPGFFYSLMEIFEIHYYFPGNLLRRRSLYDMKVFSKPVEVDWVPGTAFMIRRSFFEKLNGFDENFFMYSEDTDLCKRIKNTGGKIYFYPNFEVVHYRGKSSEFSDVRGSEYYKSLYLYHLKHSGALKAFFLRIALAFSSLFYIIVLFFKILFCRKRREKLYKIKSKFSLLKWSLFL